MRLDSNPTQEEFQPTTPIASLADRQQTPVVFIAVVFKKSGQIQERLRECATLAEKERDEQPPHTAVAIQERVDGLKK